MTSDVVDEVVLLAGRAAKNFPQPCGLDKVLVSDGDLLRSNSANPFLVLLCWLDGLVGHWAVRGVIIRVGAIVAINGHKAIALRGVECAHGAINGDLLVVDAETVTVGVGVGKKAGLEDRIGRGLNTGNQVRWGEGNLLNLGEVILGVLVQGELANLAKRHLTLRPHLGQIEDVPAELFGLLGRKDLNVDSPSRVVTLLDRVEEILSVPVGVLTSQLASFVVGEVLDALIRLEMDLNVIEGAVLLGKLEGVAGITVHVAVGVRSATV